MTACCSPCPDVQTVSIPGPPGPSGVAGTMYTGSYADPTGYITPAVTDSGNFYYQDPAIQQLNWWLWSVSAQAWVQVTFS